MNYDYDLDVVLPCYNPPHGFIETLAVRSEELQQAFPDKRCRFIVSNDGSNRNFGNVEQDALMLAIPNIMIVDNKRNAGKGAAVRSGVAVSDAKFTIYTDIDMPYSLESMVDVITSLFDGHDVVIAVRNSSYYTKLMPLRKLMSHGSQCMNRVFFGTKFTDTQGGLKGLSPRARGIMMRTKINDFLFDTEFVVLASKANAISIINVESNLRDEIVMSKMSTKVLVRELKNFFKIVALR